MLRYLLFVAAVATLPFRSAFSQTGSFIQGDTVLGHAHILRVMSEDLCARFEEESKRTDFSQLTIPQSDKLTTGLILSVVGGRFDEFQTITERIPKRKRDAYGKKMGREALLRMAATCPAAHLFLADLNYQGLTDKSPITKEERAVLQPIAQATCQRINDENNRQPLESRSTQERNSAIVNALQASILISAPELRTFYGDDVITNQERVGNMSERVALIMYNFCPEYLLMLSLHTAK